MYFMKRGPETENWLKKDQHQAENKRTGITSYWLLQKRTLNGNS